MLDVMQSRVMLSPSSFTNLNLIQVIFGSAPPALFLSAFSIYLQLGSFYAEV